MQRHFLPSTMYKSQIVQRARVSNPLRPGQLEVMMRLQEDLARTSGRPVSARVAAQQPSRPVSARVAAPVPIRVRKSGLYHYEEEKHRAKLMRSSSYADMRQCLQSIRKISSYT